MFPMAQQYPHTFPSSLLGVFRFNSKCPTNRCQLAHLKSGLTSDRHFVDHLIKSNTKNDLVAVLQWRNRHHRSRRSRLQVSMNHSADIDNSIELPIEKRPQQLASNSILKWLDIFNRFSRPYATLGVMVSVLLVSLLPLTSVAELTPKFFMGLLWAFGVSFNMNLFNLTLNQLFDVEIDKINKPDLPLATGEISMTAGILITAHFPIVSLILALKSGSLALLAYVAASLFLACAYSLKLPMLRWKENPFMAVFYMLAGIGILNPILLFLHMQVYVLKQQMVLTKPVLFATGIISFFTLVISVVKDIPDVEGDRANGIQTFAIRFGPERVFKLSVIALMTAYGVCMGIGASSTNAVCRIVSILGHAACAAVFWFRSREIDLKSKSSLNQYYMLLWQLMSAEYFLSHFMR